jgi:hypothetical protein
MTNGVCTPCRIASAFCADSVSAGRPWPCHVSSCDSLLRKDMGLNPASST